MILSAQLVEGIQYLGIRNERDDFTGDALTTPDCRWPTASALITVTTGVLYDCLIHRSLPTTTFTQSWDTFAACSPGGNSISSLEGPNEPNNEPFVIATNANTTAAGIANLSCNQSSTFIGCAQEQAYMYSRAKADPLLEHLPVL